MKKIEIKDSNLEDVLNDVKDMLPIFHDSTFYKGVSGGETVFYCGILAMTEKIGEVWIHLLDKTYIETPKRAREILDAQFDKGFIRLQSTAPADNKMLHRWMGYLGFTHEGIFRKFGKDGEDISVFSKLRGE